MNLADDRQFHRRGHHQLAARILKYRAAQGVLFDGLIVQSHLLGGERGGEARGPGADDQYIEGAGALHARLGDRLERLLALHEGILDQPHAAEFTGHVDAGDIRLEVRLEHRNIEASALGAEHQRDRIERTDGLARTVSDAVGRTDQHRFAVDEAEHLMMRLFRAGFDARSAAEAFTGIDDRMQRGRFRHAGRDRLRMRAAMARLDAPLPPQVRPEDHHQRRPIESE